MTPSLACAKAHPMNRESYLRRFSERAARRLRFDAPFGTDHIQFPPKYLEANSRRRVARDLVMLSLQGSDGGDVVDLTTSSHRVEGLSKTYDLRLYSARRRPLDALVPLLSNLGLIVIDHTLFEIPVCSDRRFIRSFLINPEERDWPPKAKKNTIAAIGALLRGDIDNDALNQLVVRAGLDWRQIDLLRTYCNYYLQLGGRVGRTRLYQALLGQIPVTRLLFAYFEARFRPDDPKDRSFDVLGELRQNLLEAFDHVQNVIDDRLLRDLFNIIDATLRTNYYLKDGQKKKSIAVKIDSMGVISAPSPRPAVEIYVHSSLLEGVHLRGAKVARGGIRWSDRIDDLRSEILELMQTQMIKNALIVPQGAKGGFILKPVITHPLDKETLAKQAYSDFINSLLTLTDNPADEEILHTNLVAYDDVDPYLVVAADKGTATWSDIANQISEARNFWLGDAFATGGSNGFHHKRLGITARGAWVCVRRHLRELNHDIDKQFITVVGVGSMDGDVFGNGMLETTNIKLLGAFSGSHIFIDPDPDPSISYAERRRLFETPRSTWADYDQNKISSGGGVYRRDAKDIELSSQARSFLQARNRLVDGEALIRLLLSAPVDLLWMGGIGTYVKASFETDESVGDRGNDGARVNANQLRAKIVGEGANLAFTRHARVEYALCGGKINSDAIDNSAGVDLSDHEVNLKIGLKTPSEGGRNTAKAILEEMTQEVCQTVLENNFRQSLCLSLERRRSVIDIDAFMDLADRFEASGHLDRRSDAFPSRKDISTRADRGLTRPELALLMAHSKLALKRALLEAPDFLRGEWVKPILATYFPPSMRASCLGKILIHPLAREIAATVICNRIIDQAGARFLLFDETAAPAVLVDAVGAYLSFDEIMEGERWRTAIRNLSDKMTTERQYEYLQQFDDALIYLCRWAIGRGRCLLPYQEVIAEWRGFLRKVFADFPRIHELSHNDGSATDSTFEAFKGRVREFPFLVELARESGKDILLAARLFDGVVGLLGLRRIATLIAQMSTRDAWERSLQSAIERRLYVAPARVAEVMLRLDVDDPAALFETLTDNQGLAELRRVRKEIIEGEPKSILPFALLSFELDAFVECLEAKFEKS